LKVTAEFIFETEDAGSIYRALLPELETPVSDRSVIGMSERGSYLVLNVETDDVISMRSALNTWFRLIQIADGVLQASDSTIKQG
jgi:KEOPS complex subunit Pcc1